MNTWLRCHRGDNGGSRLRPLMLYDYVALTLAAEALARVHPEACTSPGPPLPHRDEGPGRGNEDHDEHERCDTEVTLDVEEAAGTDHYPSWWLNQHRNSITPSPLGTSPASLPRAPTVPSPSLDLRPRPWQQLSDRSCQAPGVHTATVLTTNEGSRHDVQPWTAAGCCGWPPPLPPLQLQDDHSGE